MSTLPLHKVLNDVDDFVDCQAEGPQGLVLYCVRLVHVEIGKERLSERVSLQPGDKARQAAVYDTDLLSHRETRQS